MISEEWILDCVEKGELLDVKRYLLEVPPSEEEEVAGVLEDIDMEEEEGIKGDEEEDKNRDEEEDKNREEERGHNDERDGHRNTGEPVRIVEAINSKERLAIKKPEKSSSGWMSMFTRKRPAPDGDEEVYVGKRGRGFYSDDTSA